MYHNLAGHLHSAVCCLRHFLHILPPPDMDQHAPLPHHRDSLLAPPGEQQYGELASGKSIQYALGWKYSS